MSILIAGGLGYIGGRLANFLRERTDEKICLTTTITQQQFPAWTKRFVVSSMNVQDEGSIRRCVEMLKPDTIVHLGAMNQQQCEKDPKRALDVNVEGTRPPPGAAGGNGKKRVVCFSTVLF